MALRDLAESYQILENKVSTNYQTKRKIKQKKQAEKTRTNSADKLTETMSPSGAATSGGAASADIAGGTQPGGAGPEVPALN